MGRGNKLKEILLSLVEVAELENLNYKTICQRISRNTTNYSVRTEKSVDGGKERVMVTLSSLSNQAKKRYKAKQKIEVLDQEIKANAMLMNNLVDRPWYVDVDLDSYIENNKEYYYKAIEYRNTLRKFINHQERDRSLYAKEFADDLGISSRTLYRDEKKYLEATAWAYKIEKEDGQNHDYFQVLALCRKPSVTGTFPSISFEVKTMIENIIFDKGFAQNHGTREMAYLKLSEIATKNGWKYPSYQTVTRYINYILESSRGRSAHYLVANGERDFKNRMMTKAVRDLSKLKVMEMVQGDEHTFDCWVSYRNQNGKVTAIKPVLVAWLDMRSRAIMGDIMCKNANMQILKQSLFKMIYSDVGGTPQYILIDNGKDYTGKQMTGLNRNQRRREESDAGDTKLIHLDSETEGIYRSIGIEDFFRALPYEGWVKGEIERFFGSVCTQFTKWINSYTGTLTGSRTVAKIRKDVPKMLERGELLTLEEFFAEWTKWLNDFYMKKIHRGLKEQKEEYTTPLECFENADSYYKAAPPKSMATMLMMKADKVLVRNVGIKRFGYYYNAPELYGYINQKVNIKYDPEDVTRLYVYDNNNKKICEAESQELLLVAPRMDQEALTKHMKHQKEQLKQTKEQLREYQKPLSERNAEYVNADYIVGGIDLTIGKKRKDNVVTLPADRQYIEETLEHKKNPVDNTFFNKKAQQALDKLRQLG